MKWRHSERSEEPPREAQRKDSQLTLVDTTIGAAAFAAERFARGPLDKLGVTLN
jgi:hypothetical protein